MTAGDGWNIDDSLLPKLFHNDVPNDRKQLQKALLDFDIKKFSKGAIGEFTKSTTHIDGPMLLQMSKYRNVSIPRISETANPSKDGIVRLLLTDGFTPINVVVLANIKGLNADTPPGTKLLLTGRVPTEGNFLVVTSSDSLTVLGGRVDKHIEKWIVEQHSTQVGGVRKNESNAPRWVSFGTKANPNTAVVTKGFKANDVIHAATKKDTTTETDEKFEQQRLEQIHAVEEGAVKKFAVPNVTAPVKAPPVEKERKIREPVNNDRGHDRRQKKGRRGRGSDDEEEVPAEFARPSAPSTLFDFMTGDVASAAVSSTSAKPVHSQGTGQDRGPTAYSQQNSRKNDYERRDFDDRRRPQTERGGAGAGPRDGPARNRDGPNKGGGAGKPQSARGPVDNSGQTRGGGRERGGKPQSARGAPADHSRNVRGGNENDGQRQTYGQGQYNTQRGSNDARGPSDHGQQRQTETTYGQGQQSNQRGFNDALGPANHGGSSYDNGGQQRQSYGQKNGQRGLNDARQQGGQGGARNNRNNDGHDRPGPAPRQMDRNPRDSSDAPRGGGKNQNDRRAPPNNSFNQQPQQHPGKGRFDNRGSNSGGGGRPFAGGYQAPPPRFSENDFPTVDEAVVQELTQMHISSAPRHRPFVPSDKKPSSQRAPAKGVPQWKQGEKCKAPWEDGGYYTATIVHLGPGDMCAVRYDEYGNVGTVPQGVLLQL